MKTQSLRLVNQQLIPHYHFHSYVFLFSRCLRCVMYEKSLIKAFFLKGKVQIKQHLHTTLTGN